MGSWSPVIIGNAFILAVIIAVALAPDSWWAQELRRGYGIRPTGEVGVHTRRDHFRAAIVALVGALLLIAFGFALAILGHRYPIKSTGNDVAAACMFGFVLLGG